MAFSAAGIPVRQNSVLNQLNPGEVEGLSLAEIKVNMLF
jgi:6-phosphofructo-2-kinase/fructose-2,6-biphosphatase 4